MTKQVFEDLVRERVQALGGKPLAIALQNGLPRDAIRSVLRGHPPGLQRAARICRALGLEFYIGLPRRAVPAEIAAVLGIDADATVSEAVSTIKARRDPRTKALMEAMVELHQVLERTRETAG